MHPELNPNFPPYVEQETKRINIRYIKKSDMKIPKVPPVRSRVQRHDREVND